jgi:DNA-binding protein
LSEKETEKQIIFVGSKPPTNYVLAVVTGFNMSKAKEVVLKARGRAISTAVDVAEITRRRFLENVKVSEIEIGSEEMPARQGSGTRNVSTIEIVMTHSS